MRWTLVVASGGALAVGMALGLVTGFAAWVEDDPEAGPTFRLIDIGSQDTGDGVDFVSGFVDVSWCARLTMLAKQLGVPLDGGVPLEMRMTATSPDGVLSVAFVGLSTSIGHGARVSPERHEWASRGRSTPRRSGRSSPWESSTL